MSFNGNQYPNFADKVITTRGDIVRGNSSGERSRYGIGAANTVLTSDGTDPAWAAHGGVPTTTKGDISGFSTTQARIPISTNNFSLYGDSSAALGLKWAASSTSTLTTTGDLLAASAANVLSRIAGGASGEVLTGNGAGVLPTFQAAGGGGASTAIVQSQSNFSTSSTSEVDITNYSMTLPTVTGSDNCFLIMVGTMARSSPSDAYYYGLVKDTTTVTSTTCEPNVTGYNENFSMNTIIDGDGDTLKAVMSTAGGNLGTFKSGGTLNSAMTAFAV